MRLFKLIVLVLLLTHLASCANNLGSEIDKFSDSKSRSVIDLSDVAYEELTAGKMTSFEVTSGSSLVETVSGRSYAMGFQVPGQNSGSLTIRSYLTGGLLMKDMYFFRPVITLLDDEYKPTNSYREGMRFRTDFAGNSYGGLAVELGENDRYVLVHTDPKMVGNTFSFVKYDFTYSIPYSPVGKLKIEIE